MDDPQERLQKSKDRAADAIDSAARTVRNVAGERVDEVRDTVQGHVDEARSTIQDARSKVESGVADAQNIAGSRIAEARNTAQAKVEQARDATMNRAEEGVSTAAHGLHNTAGRLRDVAQDLDEKDRWLGTALEKAAGTAERAGDYMSGQNVNDIVRDAQGLARTNPAAFVGGAAALGFALARIGKATVERATADTRGHGGQGGVNRAATYAAADDTRRMAPSIPTAPVKPTPAGYGTGTTAPLAGTRPATDPDDGRTLNPTQSTPLHRSQT